MYKKGLYKIRIGNRDKDVLEQFTTLEKAVDALKDYEKCWSNAWIEEPK